MFTRFPGFPYLVHLFGLNSGIYLRRHLGNFCVTVAFRSDAPAYK